MANVEFKVGDRVRYRDEASVYTIASIDEYNERAHIMSWNSERFAIFENLSPAGPNMRQRAAFFIEEYYFTTWFIAFALFIIVWSVVWGA